jgi:hypothetical protein
MTINDGGNRVFLSQKSNNSSFAPGRPTSDDIIKKYPPDFTWHELKTFIHSGYVLQLLIHLIYDLDWQISDLNLLKRNQKLEADYIVWCEGINKQYGSNGALQHLKVMIPYQCFCS